MWMDEKSLSTLGKDKSGPARVLSAVSEYLGKIAQHDWLLQTDRASFHATSELKCFYFPFLIWQTIKAIYGFK